MARRATVVGSGPNGLAAAVSLARAGYDVEVLEAAETAGGGIRTADGPLPGFRYDLCSAVHPAALSSPFFRAFGIRDRVDWIVPEASFAHPLDGGRREGGRAAVAWRDLRRTTDELGVDGDAWHRLAAPLNRRLSRVVEFTGAPLVRVPPEPLIATRFGIRALLQGTRANRRAFRTDEAAGLLAGVVAHANTRMPSLAAAGSGLFLLAHAHSVGWGYPRGGAQRIADALLADLAAHGGSVRTGTRVDSLTELDWGNPETGDLLILDTSPRLALTLPDVPTRYAAAIDRYRYGPGVAKVDFALDGPVPWADPRVGRAPTVHVGGTRAEIEAAENAVQAGRVPERPYVLVVQPSVLDDSRAPTGKHALWAYLHVPAGSTLDPTELVTRQLERFAPGFRDLVLGSVAMTATERAAVNPADVGGDILGGAFTLAQAVKRPVVSPTPWRTPMPGVYLASASAAPGPGVTGMPGWYAARTALRDAGEPASLADLFG